MDGRNFFSDDFIGMTVAFTDPGHSEWTLLRKVEEGNYQSPYGSEGTSTAWALFTCRNPQNKDDEAVIRITHFWY